MADSRWNEEFGPYPRSSVASLKELRTKNILVAEELAMDVKTWCYGACLPDSGSP